MPRNPKGEMTLEEIRNVARQHNRLSEIKGIDGMTRKNLITELEHRGYTLDHEHKKARKMTKEWRIQHIKHLTRAGGERSKARSRYSDEQILRSKTDGKVNPKGAAKPQAKTKAKARRQSFAKSEAKKIDIKTGKEKNRPKLPYRAPKDKMTPAQKKKADARRRLISGD